MGACFRVRCGNNGVCNSVMVKRGPKPKHDLYSPSCLYRRKACPGSAQMERHLEGIQSEYAEEGTLLHQAISNPELDRQLSSEQLAAVEWARQWLRDTFGDEKLKFEVPIKIVGPNWTSFGTLDVLRLVSMVPRAAEEGDVGEFKMGRNEPMEMAIAYQSSAYALGVHQKHPTVRKVRCHIVYPRLQRVYTYTVSAMGDGDTTFDAILKAMHETILACEEWNAPLHSGQHCQYCRAIALCPQVHGDDLTVMHAPETLPGVKIAELLDKVPILEQKIEALKSIAKTLYWHGVEIPGYAIEERRGARYLPDHELVGRKVEGELSKEEFSRTLTCSITELERVYCRAHPELNVRDAKAQLEAILGDAVARKPMIEVLKRKAKS